jgi:hypothetical protein
MRARFRRTDASKVTTTAQDAASSVKRYRVTIPANIERVPLARWLKIYVWLVSLLAAALLFYEFIPWASVRREEWPAWVQAVGSIFAICIAIWVPYKQKKDADEAGEVRLRDDARRICLSLRDEMRALEATFTAGPNVLTILSLKEGEFFAGIIPIPAERFPIYKSVIGRLSLIEDDRLRSDIISAYDMAAALIFATTLNNQLLFDFRTQQGIFQYNKDDFQKDRCEFLLDELKKSGAKMRSICERTIVLVTAVLPLLDREVGCPIFE